MDKNSKGRSFFQLGCAPRADSIFRVNGRNTTKDDITCRLNALGTSGQLLVAHKLVGRPDITATDLWNILDTYTQTEQLVHLAEIIDQVAPSSPQPQAPPPPSPNEGFQVTGPLTPSGNAVFQVPKLPPLTAYEFPDARYRYCDTLNHVMDEPFGFGLYKPVDITFNVAPVEPGHRVIIQCFQTHMGHPTCKWPVSSTIWINGLLVKRPDLNSQGNMFFDATQFGESPEIRFVCEEGEQEYYALVIRKARYMTIDDLVDELMTKQADPTLHIPDGILYVNRLSHNLMKVPGRGRGCSHWDLFDLKEYIELQFLTSGPWKCPLCGMWAPFQELVFSPAALQRINEILAPQSQPQEEPEPLFPETLEAESDDMNFGEW